MDDNLVSYSKNIFSNFTTKIIKIFMGFGTSIIIARTLGAEGKGYVQYILLVFGILAGNGHLGISDATDYFIKKSDYDRETIYQNNLSYLFLVWIIISSTVLLLWNNNIIFKEYNFIFIFEGILFILFSSFNIVMKKIYIAEEKIIKINNFYLINSLIVFLLILILWPFDLLNETVYFSIRVLGLGINWFLFIKDIDLNYKFVINKVLLFKEFKFGVYIYISAFSVYMMYRVDQLMIKNFLGSKELGIYSIAVVLAELVLLVPGSITSALKGKLYNTEEDKKQRITTLTIKYTFYFSLLIALIGFVMNPLIILIYGTEFAAAKIPFVVLLLGTIFAALGKVCYPHFLIDGRPKIHLFITILTLVINVILNLILIPVLKINGAAIASTISYFVYGSVYILILVKKEKFSFKNIFLFNKKDIIFIKKVMGNIF